MGDNVQATFDYLKGRRMVFSSITDNAKVGNEVWVYGTEGSVSLTIEDATFYYEKKKSNVPAPSGKTIVQRGIETGASYATHALMPVLLEFLAEFPSVSLDILQPDAIVDLMAERVDIAVRAGPLKTSSLIARKLGSTSMTISCNN